MANSTRGRKARNPQSAKPYPGFPLTAHPSGCWVKKVRGKTYYFGPLRDWKAALEDWERRREAIHQGRDGLVETPKSPTIRGLVIGFLRHKKSLLDAGELNPRTFADNHKTCKTIAGHFGTQCQLASVVQDDFARLRVSLAERLGPVALGNEIQRVRSVFGFAYASGLIKAPVVFGPGFKRPSKKTLRLERRKQGKKLIAREDVLKLLASADVPMRAMMLLALNAGLGPSDLSEFAIAAIDFKTGWVDYSRAKNGIDRRFPLWPETMEAVNAALAVRPKPKDAEDENILFITKYGNRWGQFDYVRNEAVEQEDAAAAAYTHKMNNPISQAFAKLKKKAGVELRKGIGFYTLRHIFETRGGDCLDQVAVNAIMGHIDDSMAANYRQEISDVRLARAVNAVRAWLFSDATPTAEAKPEGGAA